MKAEIIFKLNIEDNNANVKMDINSICDMDTNLFARLLKVFNDTCKKAKNEINRNNGIPDPIDEAPASIAGDEGNSHEDDKGVDGC